MDWRLQYHRNMTLEKDMTYFTTYNWHVITERARSKKLIIESLNHLMTPISAKMGQESCHDSSMHINVNRRKKWNMKESCHDSFLNGKKCHVSHLLISLTRCLNESQTALERCAHEIIPLSDPDNAGFFTFKLYATIMALSFHFIFCSLVHSHW